MVGLYDRNPKRRSESFGLVDFLQTRARRTDRNDQRCSHDSDIERYAALGNARSGTPRFDNLQQHGIA